MSEVSITLDVDATIDEEGIVVDIHTNEETPFQYVTFTYADMIDSSIEGYTIIRKFEDTDAIDVDDYYHMIDVARGMNDAASYIVEKLKGLTVVGY